MTKTDKAHTSMTFEGDAARRISWTLGIAASDDPQYSVVFNYYKRPERFTLETHSSELEVYIESLSDGKKITGWRKSTLDISAAMREVTEYLMPPKDSPSVPIITKTTQPWNLEKQIPCVPSKVETLDFKTAEMDLLRPVFRALDIVRDNNPGFAERALSFGRRLWNKLRL